MGAAAAARTAPAPAPRRSPARRSPRTRPRPQRARAQRAAVRPNPALAGANLISHSAVRTAGAISDLSDSGLIMRLTRGRSWIAVLCVLLGGIVTLNVLSLSYNATSGRVGQEIEDLERKNSALGGELAELLSAGSVEASAANLGLAVPAPTEVTYLTAGDGDADRLAKLLGVGSTFTNPAVEEYEPVEPVYEPAEPSYEPPPSSEAPEPAAAATPQESAPSAAPPSGGTTGGVGI